MHWADIAMYNSRNTRTEYRVLYRKLFNRHMLRIGIRSQLLTDGYVTV